MKIHKTQGSGNEIWWWGCMVKNGHETEYGVRFSPKRWVLEKQPNNTHMKSIDKQGQPIMSFGPLHFNLIPSIDLFVEWGE